MAKKNPENTTPAAEPATASETPATTPAEGLGAVTAPTEPPPPAEPPSGLVVAPVGTLASGSAPDYPAELDTQPTFDPHGPHARKMLLKMFPADARYLRKGYNPVTEEEFDTAVDTLPPDLRANLRDALERMEAVRPGVHTARQIEFRIFDVKINQGTGSDPTRPPETPMGGYYATDMRVLAACNKQTAKTLNVPEFFAGYVILAVEGNTLWPPRSDDDDGKGGGAPLCKSLDRHMGTKFGLCDACEHRPFKSDEMDPDGCRSDITLFVVPKDFSGILRWNFQKTNFKPGREIKDAVSRSWPAPWTRALLFGTKEEKDDAGKRRWFTTTKEVDDTATPKAIADVLRVLSRKIESEIYYPERRLTHLLGRRASAESTTKPAKANVGGLMALAGADAPSAPPAGALPDLSGGGNV